MSLLGFLILLAVAAAGGAAGRAIAGGHGRLSVAVAAGALGAIVGYAAARALELPHVLAPSLDGTTLPVLWTAVGATAFAALASSLSRRTRAAS